MTPPPPSPPPPPPPPLPSSSSSALRVGTLNIGLGLTRKLASVVDRCLDLQLDVIALQEIGDPVLTRASHAQYLLIASAGPSAHEAGVGLLISHDLAPRCRAFKRSSSGRLVGVILELTKGHQLLIVSAYMPTGLDHRAPGDSDVKRAHELYTDLITWTQGVQQVVCMGDLNETLTVHDRHPRPHRHDHPHAPIRCLVDEGFTDVYRHLHPEAARQPGFTHIIESDVRQPTYSRIDYIWTRGTQTSDILEACIDSRLLVSHHRLLWMTLNLPAAPSLPCTRALVHPQLPNLRGLSSDHQQAFIHHLDRGVARKDHLLQSLASTMSPSSLSDLAVELTSLARTSAFATLPLTGSKSHTNRTVLALSRQRRDISRLLHIARALHYADDHPRPLTRSPEWTHLYRHCRQQHQLQWTIDAYYHGDDAAWIAETQQLLNRTRTQITAERKRLRRLPRAPHPDASRAAAIHRMLQSDALPSHLYSVVDTRGELTSNADELEEVMVHHFESVFAIPPPDPSPLVPPPPDMLYDKPNIDRQWYEELLEEVSESELIRLVADLPLVSAPGEDEVSTGVWKIAIQGSAVMRVHVATLFSSCLLTASFPVAWKSSIILPFVKDALKDRVMQNIRPISLQSCLGKLFTKLIAHRLGAALQAHPILNPAQRGFILGGTTMKCIDELLDAWDWSRKYKRELYTIFYDIKQAYDSVQTPVLTRAMRRLNMPPAFINLISDSLTNLSSCVRTVYGLTRRFAVDRSIRQGDPLAPILFTILIDPLHDGLDCNPFTGQRHGCRLDYPGGTEIELPSEGYADDTAVITNTLVNLRIQNDWVLYFMRFNLLRLNPIKCELVGRGPDGAAVTDAEVARHGISVDGVILKPIAHDHTIRYLGVHVTFDGGWATQRMKALSMIQKFLRLVDKFKLTISEAVYMINVFLRPRLELAAHYVHGPGTSAWIKSCDRTVIGCLKHAARAKIHLSHTALSRTLLVILPSQLEIMVKVSELFLRVNSSDPRWGELGRTIMRDELPAVIDASTPCPTPDTPSRLKRAVYLALKVLEWSLHLTVPRRRVDGRQTHLFEKSSLRSLPSRLECSSSAPVTFPRGSVQLAHDIWTGWNTDAAITLPPDRRDVDVYTDGSFDQSDGSSAWSVVIGDQWLTDNFDDVTSDERELARHPEHLGGSTRFGASITCSQGVYPAELQAIARALAMFPLSVSLHIHSDSQASIAAIESFSEQLNERRRLRSAARTILQLITHLDTRRRANGGTLRLSHVRAHTTDTDIDSVGNRMADFQANLARSKSDRTYPLGLQQLPLDMCEQHLHIKGSGGRVIIDDIRREAHKLLQFQASEKWRAKIDPQGRFAHDGTTDLGRVTLRRGTKLEQQTLVHVATNSIHLDWVEYGDGSSSIEPLQCSSCQVDMTLDHLSDSACPDATCLDFRRDLQSDIVDSLSEFDECRGWRHAMDRTDLRHTLLSLFPPPDSASVKEVDDHTARCMIGAFTRLECSAAVKSLGIIDTTKGRSAVDDIRLRCLSNIDNFYAKKKNPV